MSAILVCFVQRDTPRLYSFEPTTAGTLSPASGCRIEYLNEGGANFVFHILPVEGRELPSSLQGKLLRLRKNLPHVPSAEEQLQALNANFRDLFPADNLIQHELISLDQGIPAALNASLQQMNRPRHRVGDFLPNEQMSGLLVTDMTPGDGEILLQLKPKWLTQSPNARPSAKRCRTCAMRAQRASERIRTATDAQESCPLDLVNANAEERKRAVHAITTDRRIREYLINQAQPLLQKLRASQMTFDQHGILRTSGSDPIQSLCKAMTLRDCTLFLKRSGNSIEARLGDLDLKQPEKLARWKKVESDLIGQGWYTNTEVQDHWTREKICLLARQ
ncbi:hypothetical protein M409DRAFT_57890 [Zasmidium cellare ATCC 36951]|uniref:Inositol-pentakisphosphate 2-kinase n=1 Tax=Zasmidium cellare ATCC 36951 TaxID=1080233 RepID=A0A6A6CB04_ZASCE|nr:uncharacterized protein M409DRAFT_57890 [Zasmidium cellare ATCC 36951]KAF2162829.1 hypothetical protein M409DRAFT_57890 [Zasmidium cellare ATCC 36951]